MREEVRELKEKAQALLAKRQQHKALLVFEQIAERDPADVFSLKKIAEIKDAMGDKTQAADSYVRLARVLEQSGHRLQAVACCKLALGALPGHGEAEALLAAFYKEEARPKVAFVLEQAAVSSAPVKPPHPGGEAKPPPLPARPAALVPLAEVGVFVDALVELCASFAGLTLAAQTSSLTDEVAGNTDFLWVMQFSGDAAHTVLLSAQRRFIVELTRRVLDVEAELVSDVMAKKLSNKLVAMYADDVTRAFAARGKTVRAGAALPVAGENAMYQLQGAKALHVPFLSEAGWAQLTIGV